MAELTLPALLHDRAQRLGEVGAIVQDETRLTYAELDVATAATAARLVAAGVTKRSRVGLLAPNGPDWMVLAWAAARIGAVLVPLSTLLKPPELEAQLRTAAVSHLIVARSYRGRDYRAELASLDPALPEVATERRSPRLPWLQAVWLADELPDASAATTTVEALESVVRPADDLVVLFTSGSRGVPKGVVHTHANAIRAVASGLDARRVGERDRLYIPMPFFWTGGFAGGLLTTLVAGATLLSESDPDPARTIAFLERERATLFRGWPDQATKVAADPSFATADLSSLRPGSLDAVLPEALRARPGTRANLFGMTETFGPYCGSRLDVDLPEAQRGSCGRPFDGVEVRLGDEDEIEVRGPNVMRTICGRLREQIFTADGWYRTGDLGELDGSGHLFYRGRLDDMFKVSGATVYPTEVEAALRSIPGVVQAYVTDVSVGEAAQVGAAVVRRGEVDVAALRDAAKERLSAFKVPKRWVLLDSPSEVPVLASGKVDKTGLQSLIGERGT